MVFSIVTQSLDIRLGMDHLPKISADTECAAAIGMLAKLCGLPLPVRQEDLSLMRETLAEQLAGIALSEKAGKLREMLFAYEPKHPVDDEKYELLTYAYEQTGTM